MSAHDLALRDLCPLWRVDFSQALSPALARRVGSKWRGGVFRGCSLGVGAWLRDLVGAAEGLVSVKEIRKTNAFQREGSLAVTA